SYLTDSDVINSLTYLITQNNLFNLELEIIINNPVIDLKILTKHLATLTNLPINLTFFNFDVNYLREIDNNKVKFTTIKIAESFVENLSKNEQQIAFISSIIFLAKSLNLKIITEGVNTEIAKNIILDLGCEEIQGLLVSQSLPAENISDFWQQYSLKTIFS
ncbi:EAL domain-containing protein, partial [Geminocystis sp. GBBB08]|uniref:EAL domain-containing protein n=1 Tax=Geminocystis sp. GBBB08 TaxID=2604140 RepID=UPI0027E2D07F